MALSERMRADLAKAERRRNIEAAGREARTLERREVGEGVAETVALGEARGGEFDAPKAGRGERDKPIRRMTGIEFLAKAGKLGGERIKIAARYGQAYRTVFSAPPLRSCLAEHVPGGEGPTIAQIGAAADARVNAAKTMFAFATILGHQHDLLHALNVVCGEEMTPREAGGNALGAAVLTTRVLIALDLIAASAEALNTRTA